MRGQWFARRFGRAPHTVVNRMDGGYVENLIQTGAIHGGVHFHVHRPEGPQVQRPLRLVAVVFLALAAAADRVGPRPTPPRPRLDGRGLSAGRGRVSRRRPRAGTPGPAWRVLRASTRDRRNAAGREAAHDVRPGGTAFPGARSHPATGPVERGRSRTRRPLGEHQLGPHVWTSATAPAPAPASSSTPNGCSPRPVASSTTPPPASTYPPAHRSSRRPRPSDAPT